MSQSPDLAGGSEPSEDEGGAFGALGEVTWSNGFGDEDLAGSAPVPPAAAPRPVAPQQPVQQRPVQAPPVAQRPVAPVPPVAQRPATPVPPVTPQPAQQRPVQAPPVAQRPVAPVPPVAQRPVAPQPPVAVQPATAPRHTAPLPPSPVPPTPVVAPPAVEVPVAPRVEAPVVTTQQPNSPVVVPAGLHAAPTQPAAQTPPAPAPAVDLAAPDWATIRPNEPAVSEQEATSAFSAVPDEGFYTPLAPQSYPTQVEPVAVTPESTANSGKGKRQPRQSKAPAGKAKAGSGGSIAGGRWKIKVFRVAIYTIMGLIFLGGLRNIVMPKATPDINTITGQVAASMGENGFPTATAEAFAVRFANTYLTYSTAARDQQLQALALYSQDAAASKWGMTAENGHEQSVVSGPFVAAKPEPKDKNNATIIIAAQVNSGVWVYLAVPVYAADDGALVISGPPAFVAPPARANSPGGGGITQSDETLSATLVTDVFTGYFQAWAKSDTTALARYTTPRASVAALTGLGGSVSLRSITGAKIPREGGDTREAQVELVWATPSIGSYSQSYRVTVSKGGDGRWYVKDIKGGVISQGSSSAVNDTAPSPAPDAASSAPK